MDRQTTHTFYATLKRVCFCSPMLRMSFIVFSTRGTIIMELTENRWDSAEPSVPSVCRTCGAADRRVLSCRAYLCFAKTANSFVLACVHMFQIFWWWVNFLFFYHMVHQSYRLGVPGLVFTSCRIIYLKQTPPVVFVCCFCREAIDRGLQALSKVVPGGDTFMNLGLEMVRMIQTSLSTYLCLILPL